MEFFSNEIAYSLQYFTFPLEFVGLTLAAIEVRHPEWAKLITQVVAFQDKYSTLESYLDRWKSSAFFRRRVTILGVLLILSAAVSLFITASLLIIGIAVFTMIRLTNRWVPDKAVGTLGIIIAGFGVLGEAYQFTTQIVA